MLQSTGPNRGFTLIELMVTVAILVILLTIGVPSMTSFFDRQKVVSAAEAVYSALQETKSEALSRSTQIYFKNNLGSSFTWAITDQNSCTLGGGGCTINVNGSDISNEFKNSSFNDVTASTNNQNISFDGTLGASNAASIGLTSPNGKLISISVSALGRISICSDDVGGYKSC